MKPIIKKLVKERVKEITKCSYAEATTITMMMEAKVAIESGQRDAALDALLELVIRIYGLQAVSCVDDLTKLLNSTQ